MIRGLSLDDPPGSLRVAMRMMRVPGTGWLMISAANIFPKKMLPDLTYAKMSPEALAFCRSAFPTIASRKSVGQWPREQPLDGVPADNASVVEAYRQWLTQTDVPKPCSTETPGLPSRKPRSPGVGNISRTSTSSIWATLSTSSRKPNPELSAPNYPSGSQDSDTNDLPAAQLSRDQQNQSADGTLSAVGPEPLASSRCNSTQTIRTDCRRASSHVPNQPTTQKKKGTTMTQWEYTYIWWEGSTTSTANGQLGQTTSPIGEEVVEKLNALGAEGWEIAQITASPLTTGWISPRGGTATAGFTDKVHYLAMLRRHV